MRLWHYKLIPYLSDKHLLGQHRECCALRGNGWGKKHSTVDYVFKYPPWRLYSYHLLIIEEAQVRGITLDRIWANPFYRGQRSPCWTEQAMGKFTKYPYPDHDDAYLQECFDNLERKGFLTQNRKWFRFVGQKAVLKQLLKGGNE